METVYNGRVERAIPEGPDQLQVQVAPTRSASCGFPG